MNSAKIAVASVGALSLSGGIGYLLYRQFASDAPITPTIREYAGRLVRAVSPATYVNGRYTTAFLTKWMRDANEVQFTREPWSHVRFGGPGSGLRVLATRDRAAIATRNGARQVPLVPPVRTPVVPQGFDKMTGDGRTVYLRAIKQLLVDIGESQVDARCVMFLFANESNWDTAAWCHCFVNAKAQGKVEADTFDWMVANQVVRVTDRDATGLYVLQDGLNSIDGYFAFASPQVGMRYAINRIKATGAYDELLIGTLEGAQAFARALSAGGWSPESADGRAREITGFWNACTRKMGAERFVK